MVVQARLAALQAWITRLKVYVEINVAPLIAVFWYDTVQVLVPTVVVDNALAVIEKAVYSAIDLLEVQGEVAAVSQ